MAWLDAVSPAITVDQSANCMALATDAVAYRNDRIVIRSSASNGSVTATVNNALHALYSNDVNYVGGIERIAFPTPPGNSAHRAGAVGHAATAGGAQVHDILGLARRLRNEQHIVGSPDYAMPNEGPYTHYWPYGPPEKAATLTPPRTNLTPVGAPVGSGLPIGSGVKVEVYDTGLAASTAAELPSTTKLSSADNDLVDLVNNGPKMVDFPSNGHGKAIAGVITTVAPGATIQEVRINDRSGLATDVSAACAIASSLRTLSRADYPDLIINAFGTATCDLNPTVPGDMLLPLGMEAVVEVIDKFDPSSSDGMLIVVVRRQHGDHPAALPGGVSLGAQRRRARRHRRQRPQPVVERLEDRPGRGVLRTPAPGSMCTASAST